MRYQLWLLGVWAACGSDPALHVVVQHPAGIAIDRTVVSVYESAALHCEDIAFSRLLPDELDAILVSESTGELGGISRTDHKVIVARGYSNNAWLTAGCVEQDLVDGDLTVTITTMATVTAATVLDPSDTDPSRVAIATTDASGKAVSGRRVSWTVYGPAGTQPMYAQTVTSIGDAVWQPTEPSCTTSSGAATVHPIPPSVIGGYGVQLRAEWATQLPPLYSRLGVNANQKVLAPPNPSRHYCAMRVNGMTRRLVCLDGASAHDYEVVVVGDSASLVQRDMALVPPETVAVVGVPNGSDRDVYFVTTKGVVGALFGGPAANNLGAPCTDGTCAIEDVIAVPPCGSLAGRLLVHATGVGAPLRLLDARGGNTQAIPTGVLANNAVVRIDNAGCVSRLDPGGGAPTLRQVMTFHVGLLDVGNQFGAVTTRAIYNCNAVACMSNELLTGAGVAFTTGSEPRLVITSVDATGVVLAQVVMVPDTQSRDLFVERARLPAAAPPDQLVVGQFDTDSMTDLFWALSGRRGTSFETAYARLVAGQPLEAISEPQTVNLDAIYAGDLTGEGRDDIAITGTIATLQGVAILPMNLMSPVITIPTDPICPR